MTDAERAVLQAARDYAKSLRAAPDDESYWTPFIRYAIAVQSHELLDAARKLGEGEEK